MYNDPKSLVFHPFRTSARIATASVACTFIAIAIGGCSMSDSDWQAAKYCGYGASSDTSGMCRQARKGQLKDARAQAWERKQAREARMAAGMAEADRRHRANRPKLWAAHVKQASVEERASSRNSPTDWLNGVWCGYYKGQKRQDAVVKRIQVLSSNHIAITNNHLTTNVYRLERKGNLYHRYSMFPLNGDVTAIRKNNQDHFAQPWTRKIDSLRSWYWSAAFSPIITGYRRCTDAILATREVQIALNGAPAIRPKRPRIPQALTHSSTEMVAMVRGRYLEYWTKNAAKKSGKEIMARGKYPKVGWLTGIWCAAGVRFPNGQFSFASFTTRSNTSSVYLEKMHGERYAAAFRPVRGKGKSFELRLYGRDFELSYPREPKKGGVQEVYRLRQDNSNQFTLLSEKIRTRGGTFRQTRIGITFRRCTDQEASRKMGSGVT